MATNGTSPPRGCGADVDSLYYLLCDLGAAWGVALEAVAAAGAVFSLVLFMALLASLPFVTDRRWRSGVAPHALFLLATGGLFGLAFAFIVGRDLATCAARRFLFGVLFAGCFSCLLAQSVRLNVLARSDRTPPPWALCAGALGAWLVEVIINAEWLIITLARHPLLLQPRNATAAPCDIANQDFVMALIYVMALMAAVVAASLAVMAGKHKQWRREGACILASGVLSAGIWAAWISMYLYGNGRHGGGAAWDDPTLTVALVANGWLFLAVYTLPQICCISGGGGGEDEGSSSLGAEPYPGTSGGGYEDVLKEQSAHSMFMENKAFSMDEPSPGFKPVSPYSGYTGQLRSAVYQPTELALITKAIAHKPADTPTYDIIIPRASANSAADSRSSSPSTISKSGSAAGHANGNTGGAALRTQWP